MSAENFIDMFVVVYCITSRVTRNFKFQNKNPGQFVFGILKFNWEMKNASSAFSTLVFFKNIFLYQIFFFNFLKKIFSLKIPFLVDLWRKKIFWKNFKKNFDPKKLGIFFKTWFVKKYLALVKKWWYIIKCPCLEYMKTCFKHQKYPSFSLSELNYFLQSASGYPVLYIVTKKQDSFKLANS